MVEMPQVGQLQFPLEQFTATCNFLTNSYCPILAGEVLTYSLIMPIPAIINDVSGIYLYNTSINS